MSDKRKGLLSLTIALVVFVGSFLYGTRLESRSSTLRKQPESVILPSRTTQAAGRFASGDVFMAVLKRNLGVLTLVFAGSFTLGLESFVVLSWNGLNFGITIGCLRHGTFPSVGHPLALVLPHAFSEFLGILLAASIGFRLLIELICYTVNGDGRVEPVIKYAAWASLTSLLLILASACIEAYVSPWLSFGAETIGL
jgi:uncharacterized membrane protein SpoIIM required for sporulation